MEKHKKSPESNLKIGKKCLLHFLFYDAIIFSEWLFRKNITQRNQYYVKRKIKWYLHPDCYPLQC